MVRIWLNIFKKRMKCARLEYFEKTGKMRLGWIFFRKRIKYAAKHVTFIRVEAESENLED